MPVAKTRLVVLALLLSAIGVGFTLPSSTSVAGDAVAAGQALSGRVGEAERAVDAARATQYDWIFAIEALFQEQSPASVDRFLEADQQQVLAWTTLEELLTDLDSGALLDDLAGTRAELDGVMTEFRRTLSSSIDGPGRLTLIERANGLIVELRDGLDDLEARFDEEIFNTELDTIVATTSQLDMLVIYGGLSFMAMLLAAAFLTLKFSRRHHAERARVDGERERTARRSAYETMVMRGLEMAKTEPDVFELVGRALLEGAPGADAEVLVADSSRAHFRRVVAVGEIGGGCGVVSPLDCPATTRGQTSVFASDSSIDTCPHLLGRGCSATCVPMSVGGKTTGVMHVTGPSGQPPSGEAVIAVEVLARRASERVAMVRAFEQTSMQANTDALTGLANRRAIETRLREEERVGDGYALAYCDLDHFKDLNDLHGHETGDRALRLFARVLRDAVRPTDVAARYGGEEFLVLLAGCGAADATVILNRIRENLAGAVLAGSVPPFTCSFGLAVSSDGNRPDLVIAAADGALLDAKATGRDRVVLAGEPPALDDELGLQPQTL